MMRAGKTRQQGTGGFTAAVIVVLSLVLAADAAAKVNSDSFSDGFSVQGSNGYTVSVEGWPESLRVLVTSGRSRIGNVDETEYVVPASTTRTEINADLGDLGSVAMHFQPSGEKGTRTSPKGCQPHKVIRQPGTFVGSFHFVGEDEYTKVESISAEGSVGTPGDLLCSSTEDGPNPRLPARPYLSAATEGLRGYLSRNEGMAFGAELDQGRHPHASFSADLQEKVGKTSIARFVQKPAPASSFTTAADLARATVVPPPPFSGTATFLQGDKRASPIWSGTLTVSFPGKTDVPLTGRAFKILKLGQVRLP